MSELEEIRIRLAHAYKEAAERISGTEMSSTDVRHQMALDLRTRPFSVPDNQTSLSTIKVIGRQDIQLLTDSQKDYRTYKFFPNSRILRIEDSEEVILSPAEAKIFHPIIAFPEWLLPYTELSVLLGLPPHRGLANKSYLNRLHNKIRDPRIGGTAYHPQYRFLQTVTGAGVMLKERIAA